MLGKWGDERAIDPLISCLHDQDCQYLAVRVIGVPPDHSGAAEVRAAAATALGQLGNMRALDALSACLSDEYPEVQRAAAEALEQLPRFRPK
jgi:HEAT repeat protein